MSQEVRVAITDLTGSFVINVPRRINVQWQDEMNGPGVGSFDIDEGDSVLTAHPSLIDDDRIVKLYVNGVAVKAWLIEGRTRVNASDGSRMVHVFGRGVLCLLGNAVVWPEYALRRNSADERSFDFGSAIGSWYTPSEWVAPLGVSKSSGSSIRYPYPTGWPDSSSQWIWSSPGPNVATPPGYNFFRGSFGLSVDTRVMIFAGGDDRMQLQLDGDVILQTGNGAWVSPSTYVVELTAGTHELAGWVYNHGTASGGNTAGGFICCVAKVDTNNKVLSIIKRSSPTSFLVYNHPSAPGWHSADVLHTLVTEGTARGAHGYSSITLGFTPDLDTNGAAWVSKYNRSFRIGTTNVLDVLTELTQTDPLFDVEMTPDLVLNAFKGRGTDRSATVRLAPAKDTLTAEATSASSKIRNRALVRHKQGWIQANDATSESTYGRRETGINLGNTSSDEQANAAATAAFKDTAHPEVTASVTITSVVGPQPYVDFDIFDIITAPGTDGLLGSHRVLTITGAEDNNGVITYTLELYPEV